jgi:hypothetical protein
MTNKTRHTATIANAKTPAPTLGTNPAQAGPQAGAPQPHTRTATPAHPAPTRPAVPTNTRTATPAAAGPRVNSTTRPIFTPAQVEKLKNTMVPTGPGDTSAAAAARHRTRHQIARAAFKKTTR